MANQNGLRPRYKNLLTVAHKLRPLMTGKHIVIYEPSQGGHQMILIRYLLNSLSLHVSNLRVTLLMSAAASEHPNTRVVVEDFAHIVTFRVAPHILERNWFFR